MPNSVTDVRDRAGLDCYGAYPPGVESSKEYRKKREGERGVELPVTQEIRV